MSKYHFSDTELIVTGGDDGTEALSTVEKYDVDGNLIETLPNLKTGRYHYSTHIKVLSFYLIDSTWANI